jgi:hypothetical protein
LLCAPAEGRHHHHHPPQAYQSNGGRPSLPPIGYAPAEGHLPPVNTRLRLALWSTRKEMNRCQAIHSTRTHRMVISSKANLLPAARSSCGPVAWVPPQTQTILNADSSPEKAKGLLELPSLAGHRYRCHEGRSYPPLPLPPKPPKVKQETYTVTAVFGLLRDMGPDSEAAFLLEMMKHSNTDRLVAIGKAAKARRATPPEGSESKKS